MTRPARYSMRPCTATAMNAVAARATIRIGGLGFMTLLNELAEFLHEGAIRSAEGQAHEDHQLFRPRRVGRSDAAGVERDVRRVLRSDGDVHFFRSVLEREPRG